MTLKPYFQMKIQNLLWSSQTIFINYHLNVILTADVFGPNSTHFTLF